MKHTINTIEHPLKSVFLDRAPYYVNPNVLEVYLEKYCLAGEHQDGVGFWNHFDNLKDLIEDFRLFVEFAEENN